MTDKASPDRPTEEPDLARFLEDWTAMWRGELQAQTTDPEAMAGALEMWRAAISVWTGASRMPPMLAAASRDRAKVPPDRSTARPSGLRARCALLSE